MGKGLDEETKVVVVGVESLEPVACLADVDTLGVGSVGDVEGGRVGAGRGKIWFGDGVKPK